MQDLVTLVESIGFTNVVTLILLMVVLYYVRGLSLKSQAVQSAAHADVLGVQVAGRALQTLTSSNDTFATQLAQMYTAMRVSDTERGAMSARIEFLQIEIDRYKQEIAQHMTTIQQQQKQIELLTAQLQELLHRVERLEAALVERDDLITKLKAQIVTLQAENESLRQKIGQEDSE